MLSFANVQVGEILGCFFICNFTSWRFGLLVLQIYKLGDFRLNIFRCNFTS